MTTLRPSTAPRWKIATSTFFPFVVAAVVTPPDVLSQLLLAIPMCVLYEAGLVLARFVPGRLDALRLGAPSDAEAEREPNRAEQESKESK